MILSWTTFSGEFPRIASHLLPDDAALFAQDCDFTDGSLKPLAEPSEVIPMAGPVHGLFSDDGLRFLTWPEPTQAYLSQTVDDAFDRVYFCNSGGLRVTQRSQMKVTGGQPASSWKVGVPAPIVAPTIGVADRGTWPTDSAAYLTFKFFFERGGQKVDEAVFNPFAVQKWRKYQISADTIGVGGDNGSGGGSASTPITITGYTYRRTMTSGEDTAWVEEQVDLPATSVTIVDSDSLSGLPASGGLNGPPANPSISKVRVSGSWIDLSTLYLAQNSGSLGIALGSTQVTQTAVAANVDTSLACVEVSLIGGDGKAKWTAYSKNSAFANSVSSFPGGVEVVVSIIEGTLTVELIWGVADTRAYVATAVNQWGEESAPSPATTIDMQYIQQAVCVQAYTQQAGYYPLKGMTFYRTSQGSSDYFAVSTEYTQPGQTLNDTSTPAGDAPGTAIVLASFNWVPPPAGARNLVALPNGIFAVSDGKDIWFCEPYRPHTYPYSMTLPHAVVGMCAADNGMVVTTTAFPFWVSGAHSSGMSNQLIQAVQAGISNESMCRVGDGVVYASNDGLVFVRGLQASLNESERFFTREKWRDRYKSRLRKLKLFSHDGYICGIFNSGYGFYIRLDENAGTMTEVSTTGLGAFLLPQTDAVYIGTDTGIQEFSGNYATTRPFYWYSKERVIARPQNFGAAQIQVDGSVLVSVIGDGRTMAELTCDGNTRFRLSASDKCEVWQILIAGSGRVTRFYLAGSFLELKDA